MKACGYCGGSLTDNVDSAEWALRHGFCCENCEDKAEHHRHSIKGIPFDPYCAVCMNPELFN